MPHVLTAQQATLKGTVISADDFEPIPGVHVFIASSMIGTVTNDEGEYSLTHLPPGAVRLTFSMVGFETLIILVFVKPGEARTLEIDLKPHAFQLDGIIVEARRDKKWQRQLKRFTRHFLGQTPNAGNTEITNPEVLDFTIEDGRFRASASEPLFIENRALGYLIHFHMKDFLEYKGAIHYQGVSFYEELVPEDVSQAAEWKSKREEAYHGSRSHLLRALFHNRLEEEQFELYEHRSPQLPQTDKLAVEDLYAFQLPTQRVREAHDLVHTSTDSLTRRLDFESVVEIVYKGELESSAFLRWQSYKYDSGEVGFQQSWMVMREPNILVDHNGSLLNPYDLMYYGYLSFEAFADELPYEYGLGAPLQ
ncbi:MAG: carboxypeptidase-like regulatory domain-containing protein [Rhodothermales bacterium]